MPTLKQLRYLVAIAREGSFVRAAETCAISQPALSMQIRNLELELDVVLLERRANGVTLTSVGADVVAKASSILRSVSDLEDYVRVQRGAMRGRLNLGIIPTIAPYIVPDLLKRLTDDYPGLDLRIRETQTANLLRELSDGQVDAAVAALPIAEQDLETEMLFEDQFFLATPRERHFQSDLRATPDLFADDHLLLLEEGHCLRDQALAFCELQPAEQTATLAATSLTTLVQMVANGMGLTLLPEISVGVEAARSNVAVIAFADPAPSRSIGITWRRASPREPDILTLGALVKQAGEAARRQAQTAVSVP